MTYYFLDFNVDNQLYMCEHMMVKPDQWLRDKYDGNLLETSPKIVLPDAPGKLSEHLSNSQVLLILRDDLVALFESIEPISFKTYKVAMRKPNNHSYYYVHTLNNISGVDLEQSEVIQKIPNIPVYAAIHNLTLNKEKINGRHIFRLQEIKTKLVVSETVKIAMEKLKIYTTAVFTPCAGFNWR